ncbi:asparagine synthase (glutamine-hydrolyzing) [Tahibacter amnicola]|uniref:asparagine synthase (glutamine-hydrolyzing) n=1 Tax=Tahibacter amnicola TaxID=2976241 RepID=A0ABY6BER6_9GAMM|nr:asparagine synthase (glutamine-hydrolyzing) [Tahibacter amnicola]UXI66387.1 asparagine synthase (glutamine-hydrolyzing) [Tahibacter amnicola]
MCGLAVLLTWPGRRDSDAMTSVVRRMCESLRPRGPDGEGFWQDPLSGVCLGHRRLSIIDLDARASQPMVSGCGQFAIVYNGELYNYETLRQELIRRGVRLRTNSDTEVLLELFVRDGEAMLSRLRGMFAIAIWDAGRRRLFLARDPYGIKPLYYASTEDGLLVASQVRAIIASGKVDREGCPQGQASFWMLGSVAEPYTWFRAVRALPAGHFGYATARGGLAVQSFWNIGGSWNQLPDSASATPLCAARSVRQAVTRSVSAHMVADVPVGILLSGGVDSSCLAAVMQQVGTAACGITLQFAEFLGRPEDESARAAEVAGVYGIRHVIRRVDRAEFERDLPALLVAMDQPSIDGVNTWYATKAAAENGLKVVLSGVGADELFQGYSLFREVPGLVSAWRAVERIPGAAALAEWLGKRQSRRSGNPRWALLPRVAHDLRGAWFVRRSVFAPGELAQLLPRHLADADHCVDPIGWVAALAGPLAACPRLAVGQLESMAYLRNQLLRDSDWASMSHGVELRTPFVDAVLLRELQPLLAAFSGSRGKRYLAQTPVRPLPSCVWRRRKTGFCIPVEQWLGAMDANARASGGGLRGWARWVAASYDRSVSPCG